MAHVAALWLGALLLLAGGTAKHQHHRRKHVLRQVQQRTLPLTVLHHIADVARADAQTLRRHHRVLRRDGRIGDRQHQVAHAGTAGCAVHIRKGIQPLLAVGAEDQHHGRSGDKGLVVAGFHQRLPDGRVGDVQNGVQLLVPRSGCLCGGLQNQPLLLRCDGALLKGSHGLAPVELPDDLVHCVCLPFYRLYSTILPYFPPGHKSTFSGGNGKAEKYAGQGGFFRRHML